MRTYEETAVNLDDVGHIIKERHSSPGGIISILEAIQRAYGYLPQQALNKVAEDTGRSLVDIYGVATFYKAFSLKPRGKHLISVCMGTACHVRGAPRIVEEFEKQLGICPGETTADRQFSLETVNCLGACALGPTVVADGHYFRHVTTADVSNIIQRAEKGIEDADPAGDERIFPLTVSCPHCKHSLMDPKHNIDGHPSICLDISCANTTGWLRLSSLYGSYHTESQHDCPAGDIAAFCCPHCRKSLNGPSFCPDCGTRMALLAVSGETTVHVCMKSGCRGHRLDILSDEYAQ
jgi:NADH-quinone oxidoreductase subunit E